MQLKKNLILFLLTSFFSFVNGGLSHAATAHDETDDHHGITVTGCDARQALFSDLASNGGVVIHLPGLPVSCQGD
jgi:hypothetical protein